MRVTCSSCSANYTIADDKVRNKHVKLRCKKCGVTIVVDGTTADESSGATGPAASLAPERNLASLQPAKSAPVSEPWTVNLSDEDEREMTLGQLVVGYLDGTVTDDAFVWKEGMGDWVPVLSVPELKTAINAAKSKPKSSPKAAAGASTAAGVRVGKTAAVANANVAKSPAAAAKADSSKGRASSKAGSPKAASTKAEAAKAASGTPKADVGKVESRAPRTDTAKAASGAPTRKRDTASTTKPEGQDKTPPPAIPPAQLIVKPGQAAVGAGKQPAAPSGGAQRAATAKHSTVADLFSAAARAGSEEETTAAPHHEAVDATRPTTAGTRNESSVLFSLDALKAGFTTTGPAPKQQTTQPKKASLDAIMSMAGPAQPAGVLGFGTADLLTAPAPPPPEPKKPKVVDAEAAAVAANVAPPAPAPASGRRKLLIAAIVVIGLVGVGGLVMATLGDNEEERQKLAELVERQKLLERKLAAEQKSSKEAAEQAAQAKEAAVQAARNAAQGSSSPGEPAEEAGKDTGQKVASSRWSGVGVGSKAAKDEAKNDKPAEPAPQKKEGSAVTVSDTPSSGVSTFDKGAARSALSVAASGASGCKKADGPTGAGKVMVTFAPSGRVTSANVVGAPFAGTSVGGCVATIFRRATVPPFSGAPVTVSKGFSIQ